MCYKYNQSLILLSLAIAIFWKILVTAYVSNAKNLIQVLLIYCNNNLLNMTLKLFNNPESKIYSFANGFGSFGYLVFPEMLRSALHEQ